ncbi:unnamed protein product [Rangifer tarandus platyrhynchus]|uniref:Uncharacterized protein n=2 Tax=Rangifer tarandus platyrhynchus TaxID=3082113 RepID=A0AC59ZSR3_RANTA|nr:unnamed protein product [Rangifer tarandus platyrhynchus]
MNQGKLEQQAVERSYPMSKVRGNSREELPHVQGWGSDREEPHVQGQGQWLRGDTPCPRSEAAAKRRYPMFKVSSGGREELPHVQGRKGAAERRYLTPKVRETPLRQ